MSFEISKRKSLIRVEKRGKSKIDVIILLNNDMERNSLNERITKSQGENISEWESNDPDIDDRETLFTGAGIQPESARNGHGLFFLS